MEVKLHFLQYYLLIWKTGFQDTKEYYQKDRKSLIGNIISAVISAIISPLLLYRFGGADALLNLWLVSTVVLISAIIGAVGWIIVLLLWNVFIVAPVKLYREKEAEANKLTWKDVEFLPYTFPNDSKYGIGLWIINNKPKKIFNITKPSANITQIIQNDEVIYQGVIDIPIVYGDDKEVFTSYYHL